MAPALPSRPERRIDDLAPVPLLSLGSHLATNYQPGNRRMVSEYQHRAGLAFLYGSARVHGKRDGEHSPSGGRRAPAHRPPAAGRAGIAQATGAAGLPSALRQSLACRRSRRRCSSCPAKKLDQVRPAAAAGAASPGLADRHSPGFAYDLTAIDARYAEIDESAADDWFDLDLGIVVDGQRIGILPVLLRLIRQSPQLLTPRALAQRGDDEQLRVQLERRDGQPLQVALSFSRIKPIRRRLANSICASRWMARAASEQGRRRARPARKAWRRTGAGRAAACIRSTPAQPWRPARPATRLAERHPAALPAAGSGLMQTLRAGAGGILGDDMGLGKTLQSTAHPRRKAGRTPGPPRAGGDAHQPDPQLAGRSQPFRPHLRVLTLTGSGRQKHFAGIADHDLLLTSYALLTRDIAVLREQPLHLLILDEAQHIKNPSSKAAQAVRELQTRQRLC